MVRVNLRHARHVRVIFPLPHGAWGTLNRIHSEHCGAVTVHCDLAPNSLALPIAHGVVEVHPYHQTLALALPRYASNVFMCSTMP